MFAKENNMKEVQGTKNEYPVVFLFFWGVEKQTNELVLEKHKHNNNNNEQKQEKKKITQMNKSTKIMC